MAILACLGWTCCDGLRASPITKRKAMFSACWRMPWSTIRSEEHTSELQSLMRISYAVFCLKKKNSKLSYIHANIAARDHLNNMHTAKEPIDEQILLRTTSHDLFDTQYTTDAMQTYT